jgi:hypothetical protein
MMMMKTGAENRVYQQMQGIADNGMLIFQEELRQLSKFASDSLLVKNNTLHFYNTSGSLVCIENFGDSLMIVKTQPDAPTSTGQVNTISGNFVTLKGTPDVPAYSIIKLKNPSTGLSQSKLVTSYISGAKKVTIAGEWDFPPTTSDTYEIISSSDHSKNVFHIKLIKPDSGNYTFNLGKINDNGERVTINNARIISSEVNVVTVSITIKSREQDLYQDQQPMTVNLQKDFFLRGYKLSTVGS